MSDGKRLVRTMDDRRVAGVCGGIAEYFGWDPAVVRIVYLLLTLFTALSGVLVYIVLWIIMPKGWYE